MGVLRYSGRPGAHNLRHRGVSKPHMHEQVTYPSNYLGTQVHTR